MKLKAYAVLEEDEGTGGIVFAEHAIVARRWGANEFHGGEFAGVTCRRAPWADKYAPGPVPVAAQFMQGWWAVCSGCGVRIAEEGVRDENDDEILFDPDDFVEGPDGIFHSAACREAHIAKQASIRAREREALDYFRARLLSKLSGITLSAEDRDHVFVADKGGHLIVEQVAIPFRFPGCGIGPAYYRYDATTGRKLPAEPEITICYGDREAWERWRASVTPAGLKALTDTRNP